MAEVSYKKAKDRLARLKKDLRERAELMNLSEISKIKYEIRCLREIVNSAAEAEKKTQMNLI